MQSYFLKKTDRIATKDDNLSTIPQSSKYKLALISSYQETRGTVKGIVKAKQAWTEWYHQRQEAKEQGIHFDVPPPLLLNIS